MLLKTRFVVLATTFTVCSFLIFMHVVLPRDIGPSYYLSKIYRPGYSEQQTTPPPPSGSALDNLDEYGQAYGKRANATFVVLVRNRELDGILSSIRQLESTFNKKYGYPYVFLNDEPFTEEFRERTEHEVSGMAYYGVIPAEHWYQPSWIDENLAAAGRKNLSAENIPYADSVAYRNMCRFNSGFFFRHELLQQFRYYWRVEPNVKFYCDLHYDPFLYMEENKKTYGFTITLFEFHLTIPTLWKHTKEFMRKYPRFVSKDNLWGYVTEDGGEHYNNCHFWSNFEIADMDFWRSPAYMKYFEYLDAQGGFYYERWGDAPVHSLAAALFLPRDEVHFFNEIGYRHDIFEHCPVGDAHTLGSCKCKEEDNFDRQWYSCLGRYENAQRRPEPEQPPKKPHHWWSWW